MNESNMFAVILAKLTEVLTGGAGIDLTQTEHPQATWDATSVVLQQITGEKVMYIKGLDLYKVLEGSEVKGLEANNLLVDEGDVLNVPLNQTTMPVLGIWFSRLEAVAKAGLVTGSDQNGAALVGKPYSATPSATEPVPHRVFFDRLRTQLVQRNQVDVKGTPPYAPNPEKILGGVPVLMCSGWHWEAMALSRSPGHNQAEDRAKAHARVDRVFDSAMELLQSRMAGQYYEGFVCVLGGNLVEGSLEQGLEGDELDSVQDIILDLSLKLATKLTMLAKSFPEVLVPCVTDQGKNGYDYQVYKLTQELVSDVENIRFHLPESPEVSFSTYHIRYLLTPAARSSAEAHRSHRSATPGSHDYVLTAWSEYQVGEGIIANGRLGCGGNKQTEPNVPPCQALWLAHPQQGVAFHQALVAEVDDGTFEEMHIDHSPFSLR